MATRLAPVSHLTMYNPMREGIIAQIFGRLVAPWEKDLCVMANVVQDKMVISLA